MSKKKSRATFAFFGNRQKQAQNMLKSLEKGNAPKGLPPKKEEQLSLFLPPDPPKEELLEQIQKLDVNNLSPFDALQLLFQLKKLFSFYSLL